MFRFFQQIGGFKVILVDVYNSVSLAHSNFQFLLGSFKHKKMNKSGIQCESPKMTHSGCVTEKKLATTEFNYQNRVADIYSE